MIHRDRGEAHQSITPPAVVEKHHVNGREGTLPTEPHRKSSTDLLAFCESPKLSSKQLQDSVHELLKNDVNIPIMPVWTIMIVCGLHVRLFHSLAKPMGQHRLCSKRRESKSHVEMNTICTGMGTDTSLVLCCALRQWRRRNIALITTQTRCNTCSPSVWKTDSSLNKQGKKAQLKHNHFSTSLRISQLAALSAHVAHSSTRPCHRTFRGGSPPFAWR